MGPPGSPTSRGRYKNSVSQLFSIYETNEHHDYSHKDQNSAQPDRYGYNCHPEQSTCIVAFIFEEIHHKPDATGDQTYTSGNQA